MRRLLCAGGQRAHLRVFMQPRSSSAQKRVSAAFRSLLVVTPLMLKGKTPAGCLRARPRLRAGSHAALGHFST